MNTISAMTITACLTACFASMTFAEDFKTINGKEYKDATVTRVEPDGIALKTKSGISKVYFQELPKEVQERFHYDPVKGAQFNAAVQEAVARFYAKAQQEEAAVKEKAIAKAKQEQAQRKRVQAQAGREEARPGRRPVVSSLQSIGGGGNVSPY
jgi:sRNA-binding protein